MVGDESGRRKSAHPAVGGLDGAGVVLPTRAAPACDYRWLRRGDCDDDGGGEGPSRWSPSGWTGGRDVIITHDYNGQRLDTAFPCYPRNGLKSRSLRRRRCGRSNRPRHSRSTATDCGSKTNTPVATGRAHIRRFTASRRRDGRREADGPGRHCLPHDGEPAGTLRRKSEQRIRSKWANR